MGKIFHMMGKSASGKDTLYRMLLAETNLELNTIVPYTTRPIRDGETEGVEYHFTDKAGLDQLVNDGKVVEQRCYHTIHGDWYYFTVDDGQINLENKDYLIIGTLETYGKIRDYFGQDNVIPMYVTLEDGERLSRALAREKIQKEPKYKEMCRRFLADEEDFSEDKLLALDIKQSFENLNLEQCLAELIKTVEKYK